MSFLPRVTLLVLCATLVLIGSSCRRKRAAAPAPEPQQAEHSIAARDVVMTEAQINIQPQSAVVRADFNRDSLEDIAVAETDDAGKEVIGIYLRKPGSDDIVREYFRAGGIHQNGEYKISALMSARRDGHTDLLAIFRFTDGRKEMVHFRSEGDTVREVARERMRTNTGADDGTK